MPNDDFLEEFTTWLKSHGATYHIPAHHLYRWRRIQRVAWHKTYGTPLGATCFTDGAVVVSELERLGGVCATAYSNWGFAAPETHHRGPRKTTKTTKTTKSSRKHLLDDVVLPTLDDLKL